MFYAQSTTAVISGRETMDITVPPSESRLSLLWSLALTSSLSPLSVAWKSACRSLRQKRRCCVQKLPRTSCSLSRRPPIRLYVSCHPSPSARSACRHVKAAVQPSCLQHAVLSPCFLSGMSARAQTPSIAFRHLPPKETCGKPVLGVWAEL